MGGLSPTAAALLIPLFVTKGKRSPYYKRYFNFRVPLRWYLFAAASAAILYLTAFALMRILYRDETQGLQLQPFYMIFPLFAMMVAGGGLEELGWRAVLTHNLKRNNPLLVSLGVGVLWAVWHIPLFFVRDTDQYGAAYFPFFIAILSGALLTTTLYLHTGSAVPCIVQHALNNAFLNLGFRFGNNHPEASLTANMIMLALSLLLFLLANRRRPGNARI
jgi:uncharacterized protein